MVRVGRFASVAATCWIVTAVGMPTVTADGDDPPSAPVGLVAIPTSFPEASFLLLWQAPLENGSSEITSYNVWRGSGTGMEIIGSTGVTSYLDDLSGVADEELVVIYTYYVTAVNAEGESGPSNPAVAGSSPFVNSLAGPCAAIIVDVPPDITIDPGCMPILPEGPIICLIWPPRCIP